MDHYEKPDAYKEETKDCCPELQEEIAELKETIDNLKLDIEVQYLREHLQRWLEATVDDLRYCSKEELRTQSTAQRIVEMITRYSTTIPRRSGVAQIAVEAARSCIARFETIYRKKKWFKSYLIDGEN